MEEVEKVFHMNGGLGETSYAKNSSQQRAVISKAKPTLEESVKKAYAETIPECFRIADLGCSSGPNTFVVVSEIFDAVDEARRKLNKKSPVFHVFFNDLPGNDFNTLFRSLPGFLKKLEREKGGKFGPCFFSGVPGNFYKRLFPNNSMHVIHSSYCLHWLPKVPKGLVGGNGKPMNKDNIYITRSSSPEFKKAYLIEFEESFTLFLRRRIEELVLGGALVLTLIGRFGDPPNSAMEVLGRALNDMVLEGIIEEEKMWHFNLPHYTPTINEVKRVIKEEGSFSLHKVVSFTTDWDDGFNDDDGDSDDDDDDVVKHERALYVSDHIRAVIEPTLAAEFGESIMDALFQRFTDKLVESMEKEKWVYFNLVISLIKKGNFGKYVS